MDTIELPNPSKQRLGIGVQQTTRAEMDFGGELLPIVDRVFFITHVAPDSVLGVAPRSLCAGDVILQVNGADMNELGTLAAAAKASEPLVLTVARVHKVPKDLDFQSSVDKIAAEILAKIKHDVELKARTVYVPTYMPVHVHAHVRARARRIETWYMTSSLFIHWDRIVIWSVY